MVIRDYYKDKVEQVLELYAESNFSGDKLTITDRRWQTHLPEYYKSNTMSAKFKGYRPLVLHNFDGNQPELAASFLLGEYSDLSAFGFNNKATTAQIGFVRDPVVILYDDYNYKGNSRTIYIYILSIISDVASNQLIFSHHLPFPGLG